MTKEFLFLNAKAPPVSDAQALADLKKVSSKLGLSKITQKLYGEHGAYDVSTIVRKFGSWNKGLEAAGLNASNVVNISDEELFVNLLNLWEHLGRQPRRADLTSKVSKYSQSPYNRSFSSWTEALQSFVIWANGEGLVTKSNTVSSQAKRKTGRDPSLRLRFQVMKRDNFTCKQCGASPSKDSNVILHIDHILAWSKGGDTEYENLQTLCSKCNLGKSNL